MTARPLYGCCCGCWCELCCSCGANVGDAIIDWSSLPSVQGSITSPFRHAILGLDFLWCIQQRTPVSAAPMTKDARATAIAISSGTPTITACEWCIGGGLPFSPFVSTVLSSWFDPPEFILFLLVKSLNTFGDKSISVGSTGGTLVGDFDIGGITRNGPRKINCWAVGAIWSLLRMAPVVLFFLPWQDLNGSTHWKNI